MQKTRILLVSLLLNATLGLPQPGNAQAQTQQPPPLTDSPRDAAASAARQAALPPPADMLGGVGSSDATRRAQALMRSAPAGATRTPQRQQAQAPQALPPQNKRLGVNFANYYVNGNGPRAYAQMRAAGVKHERITFNMNAIEPTNNIFTWDAYDALITDATAQEIEVLGVLIAPSDFAKQPCPNDVDSNPNNNDNNPFGVPTNLSLPWDDPNNHWAQFVFATVSRYKDNVHAWEVWNEPNFRSFWCTLPDEGPRFAQMTRVSYQAIKAADPTATVVLAPMYRGVEIGRIAAFFESLRDLPDAVANNYYHDVIGFHLYDGGHCSQFDELGFLDTTYFRPNVGVKPIWNTESGIRVRDGGWPEFATSEESAYFAVTNAAYSWHKNVGRYYYFRAIDEQEIVTPADTDKAWGLLQFNGTPRPSYTAYQTIAQYLPETFDWSVRKFGNAFADDKPNGPVSRISFYNTPLGRVSVLFNISNAPQTYIFTGILPTATLVYPDGITETLTRDGNGNHVLQFTPALNFRWGKPECQVASRPVFIIESDTQAPTATVQTPPISVTAALTLTWTSTDTIDGSGVWWHEVQYQKDGGDWTMLNEEVAGTSLFVRSPAGPGVYAFRVRARDYAGNVPEWSTVAAVTTTIELPMKLYLPLVIR